MVRPVSEEKHLLAALASPCTEIFTGYGADPAFPAAVVAFADKVAEQPPPGYHDAAVCDSVDDVKDQGRVVKLVVGWESREAHLEAKGKPGRECLCLFHFLLRIVLPQDGLVACLVWLTL